MYTICDVTVGWPPGREAIEVCLEGGAMAERDDRDARTRSAESAAPAAATGDRGGELRASEGQFQREFGRMPCGMLALSLAGGWGPYLVANDAYCQLTGYSWEELAGHGILDDVHPEDQPALEALIQALISGDSACIATTTRLIHKDGEAIDARLTGSAIHPPAGEAYLAVFVEDVTAAERAKAEAGQLGRELAVSRRLESVGHLVGGIAHDFNNLLTVIANYAGLVHEEVSVAVATESATKWEPVRCDVEQIRDAADRAKTLIRHMLAFANREPARPADVDIARVLGDTRPLLGAMLGEDITVTVHPCAGAWPVKADQALLEQVLVNVAMNAKDAMPTGGHLSISAGNIDATKIDWPDARAGGWDADELAGLLPGPYVGLRIADDGSGMDPLIAARAFEPFFTTKRGGLAAGLGLTAVQRIATQAGGKAWLRSEPGRGTTIVVVLPAAHGAGYDTLRPAIAPQRTERRQDSVLVVDDDPQVRTVVHRVLTSAGYRVATAANGQDALSQLKDGSIPADLLLTDVVMPGIVGKAFVSKVQELRPGIQVLFMSGYERPPDPPAGWPEAEVPLLAKPFSRSALLAMVARMLAVDVTAT
jgi:two-component system, cell cycle sensor histidine kinase and response regulator CckA